MEMTDEEIRQEIIWDKLQHGEYVVNNKGNVYDFETGEFICRMDFLKTEQ